MSEQAIYQSAENEIMRNLAARHQRNGGTINMQDIIKEASFCLAVSNLISAKRYSQEVGGNIDNLMKNSMKTLFVGIDMALKKNFQNNYQPQHFSMIKSEYETILSSQNPKSLINQHYNGLYGSQGGNVI